jgi:hypothetical protein
MKTKRSRHRGSSYTNQQTGGKVNGFTRKETWARRKEVSVIIFCQVQRLKLWEHFALPPWGGGSKRDKKKKLRSVVWRNEKQSAKRSGEVCV